VGGRVGESVAGLSASVAAVSVRSMSLAFRITFGLFGTAPLSAVLVPAMGIVDLGTYVLSFEIVCSTRLFRLFQCSGFRSAEVFRNRGVPIVSIAADFRWQGGFERCVSSRWRSQTR